MRLLALALSLSMAFSPMTVWAQSTPNGDAPMEGDVPTNAPPAPQVPPPQPIDPEIAALEGAREHMEKGQEFYMRGMYIEAAEEFLAAHRTRAHGAFLFNAGVAFERLRDWDRAIYQFEHYLQEEPHAEDRADVEARIARVRQRKAQAEAALAAQNPQTSTDPSAPANPEQNPTITTAAVVAPPPEEAARDMKSLLTIRTNPAGARVTIKQNGAVVSSGASPFSYSLDEGEYRVSVEHPDFRTIETPVHVRAGKVYLVIVEMSQGEFLGFLRVVTDVPGASVYLDHREEGALGHTPFQNSVSVGTHHIWIEKPGYQTIEHDIEIGIGEEVFVRDELSRVDHGRLRVIANLRGAQVYVDGDLRGVVPYEGDVPAGEHDVRVEGEDMKPWTGTIDFRRGQLTPARVRLRPAVGRAPAWVTASLAAVLLGGSIATAVLAHNLQTDLEADRDAGRLSSDDPRLAQGRWMYIGADAGFGLTAIFAGLALYYFLRDPLPDSEATVLEPRDWALTPTFSTQGAGGAFSVRF